MEDPDSNTDSTTVEKLRIAALGDLHVTTASAGLYRPLFTEISGQADVLALCGDLTDTGLPEEARILAGELEACPIPVIGVLGNHDHDGGHEEEIRRILGDTMTLLNGEPFIYRGVAFAGAKGFGGGFDRYMFAAWGETAIKEFVKEGVAEARHLSDVLDKVNGERTVVLLHYAPIRETTEGEPLEILPLLGSSRLEESIDRYRVKAVLHGHAHFGAPQGLTEREIPVYNVSLPVMKRVSPDHPYALVEV